MLDRHDKQIENLIGGLHAEKDARQSGESLISTQLASIGGQLKGSRWQQPILISVLLALVVTLLIIRH